MPFLRFVFPLGFLVGTLGAAGCSQRASAAHGSSDASAEASASASPDAKGGTDAGLAADFLVAPAKPAAGQTVVFTDLSAGGPTAWSWSFGDGATSTEQYPFHVYSTAGTFTVALETTSATGSRKARQSLVVAPPLAPSTDAYTMTATLGDGAQATTLAFDGLGLMTGNLQAQSFFPWGKVADYTGFQYLRDNDPDNMGHDGSFLTRIADDVLSILTDAQFAQLVSLATAQQDDINNYAYQRYPLMEAFRRLMDGELPTGATGLDVDSVKKASSALYQLDGQIAFDRAVLYASLYGPMATTPCNGNPNQTQLAYLDAMVGKGFNSWPNVPDSQVQPRMAGLSVGVGTAVMTYAGDIFSWHAASLDADVYFCPERHGTYYGSFYMKDAPAMGQPGYAIPEQLTATAGSALIDAGEGYVTGSQASAISGLVGTQRDNLYASSTCNIVLMRTEIATLLDYLRTSTAYSDVIKARVLALSSIYGELDGEDNYNYATVFAQVYHTMTSAQTSKLDALRTSVLSGTYADGGTFDDSTCTTYYFYSNPIADAGVIEPYIDNTDYLFFPPK